MVELASVIVALAALGVSIFLAWRDLKQRELRRDDILQWGNRSIETLQTLVCLCRLDETVIPDGEDINRARALAIQAAVLAEQGRLFFKNAIRDDTNADEPTAYQGYRPEILDHLVVAHQIACAYSPANGAERRSMAAEASSRLRRFVTMLQCEIGRERTASADTAAAGDGIDLRYLLEERGELPLSHGRNWL